MAIGDSHGNSRFVHAAIERAARLRDKVDRDVFIVSVGDFGFWPCAASPSSVASTNSPANTILRSGRLTATTTTPVTAAPVEPATERGATARLPQISRVSSTFPAAPSSAFRSTRLLVSLSDSVEALRHRIKSSVSLGLSGGPRR